MPEMEEFRKRHRGPV